MQLHFTNQIAEEIKEAIKTEDVSVIIDASNLSVATRSVKNNNNSTKTAYYPGILLQEDTKKEFLL